VACDAGVHGEKDMEYAYAVVSWLCAALEDVL
jgi:hypothetical protein